MTDFNQFHGDKNEFRRVFCVYQSILRKKMIEICQNCTFFRKIRQKTIVSVTRGSQFRFRFYMVMSCKRSFGSGSNGSDKMTSEPSVPRFRLEPTKH